MRVQVGCIGLIAIFALVISASGAEPGAVTLVSVQNEYFFLTGEEARLSIDVVNTHGHDVSGTLSVYRTLTPAGEGGGPLHVTHDSQTKALSIYRDMQSLPINAGSSADQATVDLRITLEYSDEGVLHTVTLDDIKIHFTKEPSEKAEKSEPRESTESVQPKATTSAPDMSKGQQGGSSSGKAVPGQLGQDTGALKTEIERQAALEESWKEELSQLMRENSQVRSVQAALGERGYSPANLSIKALSNDTGNINLGYSSLSAGGSVLSADIEERTIRNITLRSESGDALPEILLRNETFRQYKRELDAAGFVFRDAEQNITAEENRVTISYLSTNGSAHIGALIADGTVRWITLDTENEPENVDIFPLAILGILIAVTGVVIFLKKKKSIPVPDPDLKSDPPVPDYRREAERILDQGVTAYERGDFSDGYALVARALRYAVSHQIGHGEELTNTETLDLASLQGDGDQEIFRILSRSSLVAFAGAAPDTAEFVAFVLVVRRKIAQRGEDLPRR